METQKTSPVLHTRCVIFHLLANVYVCLFVCVLICADWIKVSGAVKTTDLFTRISGYLLRQAQEMIPTVRSFENKFERGTQKL